MAASAIAIDAAPPLWAPLRFLLTAPWFGALAGVLLLASGPDAFASRWTPALRAATHLLTLGFMTMAMIGALLQLMPVVAAAPLPRVRMLAGVVHVALCVGTLLLAAGLWRASAVAIQVGAPLLAAGLVLFVAVGLWALLRASAPDPIRRNIALALLALAATVGLGAALAAALGWGRAITLVPVVSLHAAWGLAGWATILVFAVAQHVVPMFQGTPAYPRRLAIWFAPLLIVLLSGWSAAVWWDEAAARRIVTLSAAALLVAFTGYSAVLQTRSRRRTADATMLAWRAGLAALALAAILAAVGASLASPPAALPLSVGVLTIVGFALSVIAGMLYKIVPFLLWLHLQSSVGGRVPHVKLILPDVSARRHVWLHQAATLLLCAAAVQPRWWLYPAAAVFTASNAWLGWTLVRACRWRSWRAN